MQVNSAFHSIEKQVTALVRGKSDRTGRRREAEASLASP